MLAAALRRWQLRPLLHAAYKVAEPAQFIKHCKSRPNGRCSSSNDLAPKDQFRQQVALSCRGQTSWQRSQQSSGGIPAGRHHRKTTANQCTRPCVRCAAGSATEGRGQRNGSTAARLHQLPHQACWHHAYRAAQAGISRNPPWSACNGTKRRHPPDGQPAPAQPLPALWWQHPPCHCQRRARRREGQSRGAPPE